MRYHNITKADMLNGEGLRVVLWVSGCSHKCPGCHNTITWDPDDGVEFDETTVKEIFKELNQDWCSGITLSGGDPLFPGNRKTIRELVTRIRSNNNYRRKTIWCYTGYTWEQLMEQKKTDKDLEEIINCLDILLDGEFMIKLHDDRLHYVGSSNQRILDVKESLRTGEPILYIDNSNVGKVFEEPRTLFQCSLNG